MSHHKHDHNHLDSQAGGQEALELLAYRLWEQAGRPEGQAERFWSEARERIQPTHQPSAAAR